jgi:hypothetical protein
VFDTIQAISGACFNPAGEVVEYRRHARSSATKRSLLTGCATSGLQ